MIDLLAACSAIFVLLLVCEFLWRTKRIHVETSRKIIHMGTGVLVAFMPFFINYQLIQALSIGFLAVIVVSYRLKVFQSIHAVKRFTLGELLYPIGIGVCAFLEPATWIFTAAILHLAIADSFASMAGHRWGKQTRYMIITHGKSLVGSMAFFYTSMAIFAGAYLLVEHQNLPNAFSLLIVYPFVLTLLENISLLGSDDITIPVAVIILLSSGGI